MDKRNRSHPYRSPVPFFPWHFSEKVYNRTMRRWWNGRHACFRRMCPFGREGSNPLLRILERWPSLVRHRTRNPASGFYSRAGSNPVLSFYNKQDMSYEAHVFSVILFLLLEGHLLGEQSLLSQELLLVQKVAGLQLGFLLPAWL